MKALKFETMKFTAEAPEHGSKLCDAWENGGRLSLELAQRIVAPKLTKWILELVIILVNNIAKKYCK